MAKLAIRAAEVVKRENTRQVMVTVATAVAAALLLTGVVAGVALLIPGGEWDHSMPWIVLCGSTPPAVWVSYRIRVARASRALVPPAVLERRYHGSLGEISDSARRSLRSIGASAYEVATRTSVILAGLTASPGVRIFLGVRPATANLPPIPHVISAGRCLILVESVAWPPGRYHMTENGLVHCDGVYIGQSVLPLANAVREWRQLLPRGHDVSAVVLVHPPTGGTITLPAMTRDDVSWVLAADAVADIRQRIARNRHRTSRNTVAALVSATVARP